MIARIAFLPSLAWDVASQKFRRQNWWDLIEEDLILGALPFRSNVARLHAMGVRAVVNTCDEWEGPTKQYARFGIDQLRIPTVDFTEPSLDDIKLAINYINNNRGSNGSVYVHCKAGRGRSATIVLCWLMQNYHLAPEVAQERLQKCRSQVLKRLCLRRSVRQYWTELRQAACQELTSKV